MEPGFIDLTAENIADQHLCCIIRSKKPHPGVEAKRRWLVDRLPEGHVWEGGDDRLPSGVPFIANMPTEEIFTSPLRDGVDGVVYASMPLVHGGNIIDGFHFVVKDGKIVEAHAARGEDVLQAAISVHA